MKLGPAEAVPVISLRTAWQFQRIRYNFGKRRGSFILKQLG